VKQTTPPALLSKVRISPRFFAEAVPTQQKVRRCRFGSLQHYSSDQINVEQAKKAFFTETLMKGHHQGRMFLLPEFNLDVFPYVGGVFFEHSAFFIGQPDTILSEAHNQEAWEFMKRSVFPLKFPEFST
jgi:hypothetical protein